MCEKPSALDGRRVAEVSSISPRKGEDPVEESPSLDVRTHQAFPRPPTLEQLAIVQGKVAEVFEGVTSSFAMSQALINQFSEQMAEATIKMTRGLMPLIDDISGIVRFEGNKYDIALYRMGIIDMQGNYIGDDDERSGNDKS